MDFNELIGLMVKKKASDLFITAGAPPCLKIDGVIKSIAKSKLADTQAREMVLSIMTPAQRGEFSRTNECNFAISLKHVGRFRVSAFIQRDSAGMVLRRIETTIPSFEELGMPPIIRKLSMVKRGIVFFVGATGTGKSTSLAALIDYRNQNGSGHIVSIEDPIEFIHQHAGCIITQREVGLDTESYGVALKNTLRQAPDVIMIGEIRSRETMEHAIAFAETGHLCLSTLHANNANQALDRIINFFPEDRRGQLLMDLSLNLRGIVAQQLVHKADGTGRQAVVEVLLNTPLIADQVRRGAIEKLKDIMKRSTEQGMMTFDQALYEHYKKGNITYDDAILHADSANEVRLMIKLGSSVGLDRYAATMENVELSEESSY